MDYTYSYANHATGGDKRHARHLKNIQTNVKKII